MFMKKLAILLISLVFVNAIYAQEQNTIKITNQLSQKEILLKENKRIRIKTVEGKKISGKFSIEDNLIIVKNEKFELSDIHYLKRNPLVTTVLVNGLLIYGGAVKVGMSAIVGLFADPTAFLLIIPGASMVYTGLRSPNFHKRYKTEGDWMIEIIPLPE